MAFAIPSKNRVRDRERARETETEGERNRQKRAEKDGRRDTGGGVSSRTTGILHCVFFRDK